MTWTLAIAGTFPMPRSTPSVIFDGQERKPLPKLMFLLPPFFRGLAIHYAMYAADIGLAPLDRGS